MQRGQKFAFLKNSLVLLPLFRDHSDPVLAVLRGGGALWKPQEVPRRLEGKGREGGGQGKFHRGSDFFFLKDKEGGIRIYQARLVLKDKSRRKYITYSVLENADNSIWLG